MTMEEYIIERLERVESENERMREALATLSERNRRVKNDLDMILELLNVDTGEDTQYKKIELSLYERFDKEKYDAVMKLIEQRNIFRNLMGKVDSE